jgi:hypothetical protein
MYSKQTTDNKSRLLAPCPEVHLPSEQLGLAVVSEASISPRSFPSPESEDRAGDDCFRLGRPWLQGREQGGRAPRTWWRLNEATLLPQPWSCLIAGPRLHQGSAHPAEQALPRKNGQVVHRERACLVLLCVCCDQTLLEPEAKGEGGFWLGLADPVLSSAGQTIRGSSCCVRGPCQVNILASSGTLAGLSDWIEAHAIPKEVRRGGSIYTCTRTYVRRTRTHTYVHRHPHQPTRTQYGGSGAHALGECSIERELWEYVRSITESFDELNEGEDGDAAEQGQGQGQEPTGSSWWG